MLPCSGSFSTQQMALGKHAPLACSRAARSTVCTCGHISQAAQSGCCKRSNSSGCESYTRTCALQGLYVPAGWGRVTPNPNPNVWHAERWLKPGTELAQQRPMPAEWYGGWDAQAAAGQLGVAADEAGAPASLSNLARHRHAVGSKFKGLPEYGAFWLAGLKVTQATMPPHTTSHAGATESDSAGLGSASVSSAVVSRRRHAS